jgi:cytochrome c556
MQNLFVALLVMMFLAALASTAMSAEQEPPFKPVADVRQLMNAILIPSSDALFEVGSKPPKDADAWTNVERAAVTLAESGNLLMIGSRAKREAAWMQFARALVDAGQEAVKAATKKNVDDVLAAGDKIYETCDGCHSKYMDKSDADGK